MLLVEDNVIDHIVNTNTICQESLINVKTIIHTISSFDHETNNTVNEDEDTNNVEV